MESNVERALAAKMLKLFPPTSDTFLAFPMAGAAFTAADLAIFERPGEAAADVRLRFHRKAQFSRLMNQVPADALSWSTDGELLWTQYKRVLDDAEMATSALTAAEQTRLRAARDYLSDSVRTEHGTTTVYSPEVTAYYQYKGAAEELERTYLDEKMTAEHSLDGAVRAAWDGGRRQLLEAARAKAAQDWAVLGHKAEVEAAQATVTALGAKDPQLRRMALLADYDLCAEPDLNANDPVGVRSTFYSPSDIFSPGATWNTLHLTGSEVQQLLAEAPPELAALNTSAGGDIVSMTVEYTSVTVMRPWFDPSFLAMRSWRLPEGVVVSDGGSPRRGRIPGYITSLVVARKVTIERSAPAGQGPTSTGATTALASLGFLRKGLQGLDQQWKVQPLNGPARQLAVQAAVVPPPPSSDHLEVSAPDVSALQNAHVSALTARTTVTQLPVQLAPLRLAASAAAQHVARPLEPVPVPERRLPPIVRHPGVRWPVVVEPVPQPDPLPPRPATTTQVVEEVTVDGVVVLAYRIRRVPCCPDPDPTLGWDGPPTDGTPPLNPDARPFPLPHGHSFGVKADAKVHDGRASAEDRVSVLALQARLREGGPALTVDGVVGAETDGAIRALQRARHLTVDGLVGPKTWAALWA
jgi:peptidoglycan hydrolase-like protein with peptidoglycan-binding domain